MNKWCAALAVELAMILALVACTRRDAPQEVEPAASAFQPVVGCGKDIDCKGSRICQTGKCVEPTAPPLRAPSAAVPPVQAPSAAAGPEATRRPREPAIIERKYVCAKEVPGEVRSGCACGNEIINLCYDKTAPEDMPQSPRYRIEGNTCVFECSK